MTSATERKGRDWLLKLRPIWSTSQFPKDHVVHIQYTHLFFKKKKNKTPKDKPTKKVSTELGECECDYVSESHLTGLDYFAGTMK